MKTYSVLKWCEIFGIELVDNDAFQGIDLKTIKITFDSFIEGIAECTINPLNKDKYSVLDKLM